MAKLNHEKIALYLLTTSSVREAAEKAKVAESTVYRLRKDPGFQETLNKIKDEMFQDTIHKSQGYCLEMLEVLRGIANDPAATDSSRVSAARSILELGIQSKTTELVQQEVDEIRKLMVMQNEGD
jgi:DNA-binding MurR/RpiR family transcriptional regulator